LSTPPITDPEVQALAGISGTLQLDYAAPATDPWAGSPFEWILQQRSSRRKGKIGEQLVAGWCAAKNFDVVRSGDSEADRLIEGHRVEIKLSTLWEAGVYKFQQIRDQRYEYLFCLGLAPFDARAWLIPKPILLQHVIGYMGQHTGASGTDTAWLSVPASNPQPWLEAYGGRLADVHRLLEGLGRGPHAGLR
jgi:hypothetical protein